MANAVGKLLNIDEDARLALANELGMAMDDSQDASATFRDNVAGYRDQYEGLLKAKPMEWMSNVNIPTTKSMVNTASIKVARAATGSSPIFEVEAVDPEYDDVAQNEENWLQFWNEEMRLAGKVGIAVREAMITGQCWLKAGVAGTGNQLPEYMEPGQPLKVHEIDAEPTTEYIVTEDIMLLPFTAPNFKSSKGAFGRRWLRWDDIQGMVEAKTVYTDAVEYLENRWNVDNPTTQTQALQGIEEVTAKNIWSAKFECWEGIYRWVKPGDKREKEYLILAYYNSDTRGTAKILKCIEYKPLFGDNWFFTPIICDPKPNSMWGGSMCEDIRGLQTWINATFNQITDAITINILPPVAVKPGSDVARKNLKWGPMERWIVSNPATDVQMLNGSQSALTAISQSYNGLNMVNGMAEKVTGVSAPSQGAPSDEKKTAFEINAVISAGNDKFDYTVSVVQMGIEEDQGLEAHAVNTMEIIRRFLPNEPIQYKSSAGGNEPWQVVRPEWHEGKYKFVPRGSSATSNPQTRFQLAGQTMREAMQSPFTQLSPMDDPPQVLDKIQRLYKAQREYYQAMGHKHVEQYIGAEPTTPEEGMRIAAAINPQVAMQIMARLQQQAQAQQQQQMLAAGMVPPGIPPQPGAIGQGNVPGEVGAGAGNPGGGGAIPGFAQQAGMV